MSPDDQDPADPTAPTEDGLAPSSGALPDRLGRYTVRRQIARHGQGTLLEGFDPELERTVAIKLVRPRAPGDAGPERCEREARALARLDHPNIVTVFDVGPADEGARFFVMEYLRGARSLTQHATEHELSIADRVRLAATLCDAVATGHEAGMIHRDLKPTNLLVDRDGVPHVIDFGLVAGPTIDHEDELRSMESGGVLGTVRYMSPQHFERDPDLIDERSDIYAMGVVLFELLTGRPPYELGDAGLEQVAQIVRTTPPSEAGSINPSLRGELSAVLGRALEKDPDRRYQSMAALRDDLRSWLAGAPVGAVARSPAYAVACAARSAAARFPRGSVAAVSVAVLLAVAVLAGPLQYLGVPVSSTCRVALARIDAVLPVSRSGFAGLRAVTVSDETDLEAVAARAGLGSVDPDDPSSLRALYGAVLERLAEAGPRVVAIDVGFRDRDDPGDPALVRGIEALRERGCDVIIAASPWPPSADASPDAYDSDILSRATFGGITFDPRAPWQLDLAVLPPEEEHAVPSLVLASFAAFVEPGAGYITTLDPETDTVRVQFLSSEARPGAPRRAYRTESLAASLIERDPGKLSRGVPEGSLVAYSVLLPPSDEDFAAATLDAGRVLELPLSHLQAEFGSRAVIIGLSRWGADQHRAPDGRSLAGYQVHMIALDLLLSRDGVRFPTTAQDTLLIALGAILGTLGALGALARARYRLGLLAGFTLGMMLVAAWVFHDRGFVWNPLPMLVAALVVGEIAAKLAAFRRLRGLDDPSARGLDRGMQT